MKSDRQEICVTDSVSTFANLGRIFEEYRPRLLAMLERRIDPSLAHRVDPDDVLNEAFIAARLRWPSVAAQLQSPSPAFDPTSMQYAWLYRLVLDTLIEVYRRHTRQKRDVRLDMPWPDASSLQLGFGLVNQGTSPSEAVMRAEVQQNIRRVVALLKEPEREILWMRHNDQLSFREIGAVLSITENTATVRYTRALRRLRVLWQSINMEGESQ
jgi:RNA polymerase sigma-70 factor (ECF subfamily)